MPMYLFSLSSYGENVSPYLRSANIFILYFSQGEHYWSFLAVPRCIYLLSFLTGNTRILPCGPPMYLFCIFSYGEHAGPPLRSPNVFILYLFLGRTRGSSLAVQQCIYLVSFLTGNTRILPCGPPMYLFCIFS